MHELGKNLSERFNKLHSNPIKEALIEFQIVPNVEISEADVEFFSSNLGGTYSIHQKMNAIDFQIQFAPSPDTNIEKSTLHGAVFQSTEGFVLQIMRDRLTLSKLADYDSFDSLSTEFLRVWELFSTRLRVASAARMGLRYINEIPLDKPVENFVHNGDMYKLPNDVNQLVKNSYHRYAVEKDHLKGSLQSTIQSHDENGNIVKRLVLDIDVWDDRAERSDDLSAFTVRLTEMRRLKNEIFFGLLTDEYLATMSNN